MDELAEIGRLIADADLIIKAVLAALLFQSVYIWYALIRSIFQARQVEGDRRVMLGALVHGDIDEVRRVLTAYAHLRPATDQHYNQADAPSGDHLQDDIWTEVYDALTTRCSGLATIAATAPFIGLFGTVWGILVAFSSIRSAEAISFSALAPAIGEALFATMAGLFVAIPAVIANNWITSRSLKLSRRCAQSYVGLVREITRLGRKPGTVDW